MRESKKKCNSLRILSVALEEEKFCFPNATCRFIAGTKWVRRHWKALGKVLHFIFCHTQSLSPGLELCHFSFWYFTNRQRFTLMLHIFKVVYSESFTMPRSQMKLQGTTNQTRQKPGEFCSTGHDYFLWTTKNLHSFVLIGEKLPSKTDMTVCILMMNLSVSKLLWSPAAPNTASRQQGEK